MNDGVEGMSAAESPANAELLNGPEPHSGSVAPQPQDTVARRQLVWEIWIVLALSLGADALYAVLDLTHSLTSGISLRAQSAVITSTAVANNSVLNLVYQLAAILVALVPVALVWYLLSRSHETLSSIGVDKVGLGRESLWGAGLAAGIGGAGLALYVGAYHAGLNVNVVPTNLPAVWWRIPVLVLAAVQDGVLEEVVVCGYLLHRLRQIGWGEDSSLLSSAVLRGAYHLYQGFGGFVGNAAMGLIFGRLYQRKSRLVRLVVAHSLIDTGAFVGYVLLHNRVSWLP